MLAFWDDIKALTVRKSADCKFLLKGFGYSTRAVGISNRAVTEVSMLWYSSHTKTVIAAN